MQGISHYRTIIGARGTRQYTRLTAASCIHIFQAPKGGTSRDPDLKYGYDL